MHGQGVLDAVLRRMDALCNRVRPKHIVACFDRRSFRHDLYPAYKAGRKPKEESLVRDLAEAPEALMDLATICEQDGFEADDCLASLAKAGQTIGQKVILASSDKDLRQCLHAGEVTILKDFTTERGEVTTLDWYTAAQLHEATALVPAQWIDYQVLLGQPGDNLPGCQGWGEKTTAPILARWGTIEGVITNALAIKLTKPQAASLERLRDASELDLMRRLVTLRTDWDVWDYLR